MGGLGGKRISPWIGGLVLVLVLLLILGPGDKPAGRRKAGEEEPAEIARERGKRPDSGWNTSPADRPGVEFVAAETASRSESLARIGTALVELRESGSHEETIRILTSLRAGLRAAPEDESIAAILAFLESGEDVVTGLPFIVGPDGVMSLVPTLRTSMMDLLPTLDPLVALEEARAVMSRRSSQDEYALALRNVAWNDLDGDMREELGLRLNEMLDMDSWLNQPSSGFLEAFDIALEIADSAWFSKMSEVAEKGVSDELPELANAAFVAMDRMVLRDPSILVSVGETPGWMDFAPKPRASLMSRIDVTRPEQKELFMRYLSSGSHGPGELEYFAALFPNGNVLHGHRLVSADEETLSIASRQEMDRRILEEVEGLLETANGTAKKTLIAIQARLESFVQPADEREEPE